MNIISNCLNLRKYELSKHAEIVELVLMSIIILLTPIIIPKLLDVVFGAQSAVATNSQYVVGSLVNAGLIISAINVKGWKKIVSLITFPSISAISSGLVLKTASIFTVYMIPAIWIANFTIVYLYKYLHINKKINYTLSSVVAIIIKTAIIFSGFNILVLSNILPKSSPAIQMLKVAMGTNQIITATIGAILAFGFINIAYKNKESN